MSSDSDLLLKLPERPLQLKECWPERRGNGEEADESKRGMSAQRLAEMLLASLRRSNVQLLLCLRLLLHTVISVQAPGYGLCNGPTVSCHGSQSTSESSGHFNEQGISH